MDAIYENFNLTIRKDGQIDASSNEGAIAPVLTRFDQNPVTLALEAIEQEGARPDLVEDLGLLLYQTLFPENVLSHLDKSRHSAQANKLRLRLRFESEELASLPWEMIFDGQQYLGLDPNTPIVRSPLVAGEPGPLGVDGILRILFLIPCPTNVPVVPCDSLIPKINDIFAHLPANIQSGIEIDILQPATTMALMRRMRSKAYHILHYLGYSEFDSSTYTPVLLFEEENGLARRVSGDYLGEILRQDKGRLESGVRALRLVLLTELERSLSSSKAYSAHVANTLVGSGIPASLGFHFSIPESAALKFARAFYTALLKDQEPIEVATTYGRIEIRDSIRAEKQHPAVDQVVSGEWGAPALFMHASDGRLFQTKDIEQPAFTDIQVPEAVYQEIEEFKVTIEDRLTAFFLEHLTWFIGFVAIALLTYWLTSRRLDLLFYSGVAVALTCVWLLRSLITYQVAWTFNTLWRRRLLLPAPEGEASRPSASSWIAHLLPESWMAFIQKNLLFPAPQRKGALPDQYLQYLNHFNDYLNHEIWKWAFRLLGLGVVFFTLPRLNFGPIDDTWEPILQILAWILMPITGYVIGDLLWKMIATIITVGTLSYHFELDIRPTRPDKCGGLKPLGDLYFANAWIALVAGLFIAFWLVVFSIVDTQNGIPSAGQPLLLRLLTEISGGYLDWIGLYQILIFIIAGVAAVTFALPMWHTHKIMDAKIKYFRQIADFIAAEISELERYIELFGAASGAESRDVSRRLDYLEERYLSYDKPPRWPFDAPVLYKLFGSLTSMIFSYIVSELLPSIEDFLS